MVGVNNGNNNHYYSNQIAQQAIFMTKANMSSGGLGGPGSPAGLKSFKEAATALKNSDIYAEYRETRKYENHVSNMQSLAETAQIMGMGNIDLNQLAAMYDSNHDGYLNQKELSKAEKYLNTLYTQNTQYNMKMMSAGNTSSGSVSGGTDIGSTISSTVKGLGQLFGGSEGGGLSGLFGGGSSDGEGGGILGGLLGGGDGASGGEGDGGFLSKATDFLGGLFG